METMAFNVDATGLALGGYDPVAYFTENSATPGRPEIEAAHNNVRFLFSTETHRDLFLADPGKYLPAYGAWCAWAAAGGSLEDTDPRAFVVHDGRLFLNYNRRLNRRFARRLERNVSKADRNWPGLSRTASDR